MGPLQHPLPCSEVTLSGTRAWHRDLLPTPSLASPLALVKDSSARDVPRLPGTGQRWGCYLSSAGSCQSNPGQGSPPGCWHRQAGPSLTRLDLVGAASLSELCEEPHVATGLPSRGVAAETAGATCVVLWDGSSWTMGLIRLKTACQNQSGFPLLAALQVGRRS